MRTLSKELLAKMTHFNHKMIYQQHLRAIENIKDQLANLVVEVTDSIEEIEEYVRVLELYLGYYEKLAEAEKLLADNLNLDYLFVKDSE